MKRTIVNWYQASQDPDGDMALVAYEGQPIKNRMYRHGYEFYMNDMPRITDDSPFRHDMIAMSKQTLNDLGEQLRLDPWVKEDLPGVNGFDRTVIAMESPKVGKQGLEEGSEVLVARWGVGFSSPVHGHAVGYMHEEILFGKVRVNTYRLAHANVVRLLKTEIVGPGTFVSDYAAPIPEAKFKRQTLIHNFTAIEQSASLHFVPEHTRDGRDNGFMVEYFDDRLEMKDVTRIDSQQGMYLQKGDVVLVRSQNVPEYGDHFIVITGAPVVKEHGLRPQDVALSAPRSGHLLDRYEMKTGLILLKLKSDVAASFLRFHGITIDNGEVVFPQA